MTMTLIVDFTGASAERIRWLTKRLTFDLRVQLTSITLLTTNCGGNSLIASQSVSSSVIPAPPQPHSLPNSCSLFRTFPKPPEPIIILGLSLSLSPALELSPLRVLLSAFSSLPLPLFAINETHGWQQKYLP